MVLGIRTNRTGSFKILESVVGQSRTVAIYRYFPLPSRRLLLVLIYVISFDGRGWVEVKNENPGRRDRSNGGKNNVSHIRIHIVLRMYTYRKLIYRHGTRSAISAVLWSLVQKRALHGVRTKFQGYYTCISKKFASGRREVIAGPAW